VRSVEAGLITWVAILQAGEESPLPAQTPQESYPTISLALRVAAAALISSVFTVFVAEYCQLRAS